MNELDQIDGLDANAAALERTLGDTAGMAAAFDATLRDMQVSLGETTRDLGNLERGFAGGLRRAFDGLIFDGKSLSDTLSGVAKSMIDTAYAAAINPVMKQAGSLLSDGINAAVSGVMPFAQGAPFAQGRVMPFAKGGVVSSPTTFGMRGGTGLMGEAGPEAIMPLARGADGRLGVRGGGGSSVNVTMHVTTPDAQSFQRSQAQIAAQMGRVLGRGQRNR
ncbi:phage tail tape measure protein [Loktanella salsilacus]|jgi:phage-related minor tail protein|uniref:Phage tail tape measure protein, lambda family n=1 Tax=Loktanella salsilacus TaxID=195913 RepID=A0A1I4ECC6_9RHOB|nr:phage tail tape measure protein [Loktanella salsilacus]MBU0779827.1 phage tail tape measure protein [Alphaproteobacteria bacterium]MBU1834768.1 phage tail tape measure protein [Alphaproteobacteria bacterium]UTH43182.1 phage tail tape measure protein [Loktanella salsilacus]UTH46888.1 phage tail tape measure protein [Loktanella salsilacus]SFL02630.1 phage tail tape measure protein, lambda family [Loktanella salsilacus]|tara:strand:- start:262 stop:921 length:660 start_codon:yes stop_codon:yes gene_type:complete